MQPTEPSWDSSSTHRIGLPFVIPYIFSYMLVTMGTWAAFVKTLRGRKLKNDSPNALCSAVEGTDSFRVMFGAAAFHSQTGGDFEFGRDTLPSTRNALGFPDQPLVVP